MLKFLLSLFLLAILKSHCYVIDGNLGSLEKTIKELSSKVDSYQVLKEQQYRPPFKWYEKEGLYKSDIRLNFFGNPLVQELRNGELTAVFDNDMFSTGWIITALLEANLYGRGAPLFDEQRLEHALNAIGAYRNHNANNFEKTIFRTFWPQIYNATYNVWQQQPINIRNVALNIEKIPFDEIEKVLKALKLDKIAELVEQFKMLGPTAVSAFSIPTDFDDTYLNLGLGATLYKLRSHYSKLFESWLNNNTNVDDLIEATTKYAYKPFSSDANENTIDPRTYYWARSFIQEAAAENKPLSLITTWVQNIDEQRKLHSESVSMPFNINNVDVTVAANSIYGISAASIYNINNFASALLNSPNLQQTYLNSTKFIAWAIKANYSGRPDLAQVYYPSRYNFMWYASRTLFLINNEYERFLNLLKIGESSDLEFLENFSSLKNVLFEVKSYLEDAFENVATKYLFEWGVALDSTRSIVYFRDFLGLNDTSLFGKHESNDDDALFSTAQAINILISTWTYQKPTTNRLAWKKHTPLDVKHLVSASVKWLQENIFNKKYKALNSFFSGSVKGLDSLPFWYPSNYIQFLNGTSIVDPASVSRSDLELVINGVSGVIDEATYQQQLKQTHFGFPTPLDFHGYNVKQNMFPFWSSEPYTYAVSLLALSQYNNIELL